MTALALLVAACGGEPTSAAGAATAAPSAVPATPAPSPTTDLRQVQAVASAIFPAGPASDCFLGGLDKCPFTPRLRARMQAVLATSRADPVCRCQNGYQSVAITVEMLIQPVAHVVLTFGQPSTVKMDWAFLQSGTTWLADDSYCTVQGPRTSIYMGAVPCPG